MINIDGLGQNFNGGAARSPESTDLVPPGHAEDIERIARLFPALLKHHAHCFEDHEALCRWRDEIEAKHTWILDEFDRIAKHRAAISPNIEKMRRKLIRAGRYYISDEQVNCLLALIGEVRADTRRFCDFMEVDALPRIPAHEFDDAVAALEAKRAMGRA
jgi:hypothetical protein